MCSRSSSGRQFGASSWCYYNRGPFRRPPNVILVNRRRQYGERLPCQAPDEPSERSVNGATNDAAEAGHKFCKRDDAVVSATIRLIAFSGSPN